MSPDTDLSSRFALDVGSVEALKRQARSEPDKALRSAGGTVELLEFKGLNHQIEDGDARTQMLTKAAELLDRTIGH